MDRKDFLKIGLILGGATADFVDNLFNIINWDNAAYRLDNVLKLTK